MTQLQKFDILFICFFLLIIINFGYIPIAYADDTVNVSDTSGRSIRHQIILDENLVYVIWEDHSYDKPDIFFSKSSDGGKIFSESVNISNTTGSSLWPRLAVSENDIYVTWYDYTPGISDVFFSHSSDGGLSFETINLSENIGVSFNSWISVSGDNVYVVWMDETPNHIPISIDKPTEEIDVYLGGTDVLLAISRDKGKTFEIVNLSKNPAESSAPRMSVLGNNIYISWIQATADGNQVFFTKSNDAGLTFSKPMGISNGIISVNAGILVNDNDIYLSWMGKIENHTDIFLAKSNNGGNSFDMPVNLSDSDELSTKNRDTHMAFSGNQVYIVWIDKAGDNSDVFFVKSDDGQNFSQPVDLNYLENSASYVEVVAHDENVYVMWDDVSKDADVFLRTSNDGGKTFGSIKNLSNDEAKSTLSILGPHMAVNQKGVYLGWSSDNEDIKDTLMKFLSHDSNIGKMYLETDNQSVIIEIEMIQDIQESDTQTTFNLQFKDVKTNQLLEHVNYSFLIEDLNGESIFSNYTARSETGVDTQVEF